MENFETVQNLRKQFASKYYELNIRELEFDNLRHRYARNTPTEEEQIKFDKLKFEIENLKKEVTPIHDEIMKLTTPYLIDYSEEIIEFGMPKTHNVRDILWLVTDIGTNDSIDPNKPDYFDNVLIKYARMEALLNISERKGTYISLNRIQKHIVKE